MPFRSSVRAATSSRVLPALFCTSPCASLISAFIRTILATASIALSARLAMLMPSALANTSDNFSPDLAPSVSKSRKDCSTSLTRPSTIFSFWVASIKASVPGSNRAISSRSALAAAFSCNKLALPTRPITSQMVFWRCIARATSSSSALRCLITVLTLATASASCLYSSESARVPLLCATKRRLTFSNSRIDIATALICSSSNLNVSDTPCERSFTIACCLLRF